MRFSKSIRLLVAGVISIATLAISSSYLSADAQRRGSLKRFPLLDNSVHRYFTTGGDTSYTCCGRAFNTSEREIITQRQLHTSQFQLRATRGSYTVLTTQVDPERFDSLSLRMITSDQSVVHEPQMRLILWQGGDEKIIYDNIAPGSVLNYEFTIDYSASENPGDISIELQCDQTQYNIGCIVYFTDAELSPIGNFVSSKTFSE